MTKCNLAQKAIPGISFLLLHLIFLTGCSKKDQNNYTPPVLQVELTDTTYHLLLHFGEHIIISSSNIIIANYDGDYFAADDVCPVCGYTIGLNSPIGQVWHCGNCNGYWSIDGGYWNGIGYTAVFSYTQNILKTYKVSRKVIFCYCIHINRFMRVYL